MKKRIDGILGRGHIILPHSNAGIGGSIGVIAPGIENTMSFPELLKKADEAMYEVKKQEKTATSS